MFVVHKRNKLRTLVGASVVAAGIASASIVMADEPLLTITSPAAGTTVYAAGFPHDVPVTVKIVHDDETLGKLTQFDVKVDDASIFALGHFNPFKNDNTCSSDMIANSVSCIPNGDKEATVTVLWSVSAPGAYAITASARHQSVTGETEDVGVEVLLLSVEYPAPPSVANAHLKPLKLKGGIQGCVISKIANAHAMDSKYGPKGGPYDDNLIRSDADAFRVECGGG